MQGYYTYTGARCYNTKTMTKITREEIIKLANLSRLKLDESEIERSIKEISDVLSYVEILNEVDTEGLSPTYQVQHYDKYSRADKEIDYGVTQEDLLKNVPNIEGDLIKVKRMIG